MRVKDQDLIYKLFIYIEFSLIFLEFESIVYTFFLCVQDSNPGPSPRTSTAVLSSPKVGLFKKLRARNTAKSVNRGSPGESPISSPQQRPRKISNPS